MQEGAQPIDRRAALSLLTRASADELAAGWDALADKPEVEIVRPPEFGLVMARGRIGGGGAPFNLGELTATRATVRLASGEVGMGHVLGRDRRLALLVAELDALWQSPRHRAKVEAVVLRPLRARLAAADRASRAKTAATRVKFFTLVRGEDS